MNTKTIGTEPRNLQLIPGVSEKEIRREIAELAAFAKRRVAASESSPCPAPEEKPSVWNRLLGLFR
jgi:hypothetical protein